MKEIIKMKRIIFTTVICSILLFNSYVFANEKIESKIKTDYSEEYKKYTESSDQEKEEYDFIPNQYKAKESNENISNPITIMNLLGAGEEESYSLKNVIPNDIIIKNQTPLNLCWAFSSLSSMATNLGLQNRSKTYDFSARHMDYASAENTSSGANTNLYGTNREIGSTANWGIAINYLTNGLGAVKETDMPFNTGTNNISYNQIVSKTPTTEAYKIKIYPVPSNEEQKNNLIAEVKKNIKLHGAAAAQVCGASLENNNYYNPSTGALYYPSDSGKHVDHAVAIIGWDDNYQVSNFNSNHRPPSKGAWIIQNSWGTEKGDHGLFYMSYYDSFIYSGIIHILSAVDKEDSSFQKKYDNIYLHDEKGFNTARNVSNYNTIYLGNKYKANKSNEYISMISIATITECEIKVFVNPDSNSLNKDDMQQVNLKSGGSTITVEPGFNTIELSNPIKINSDSKEFAIAVSVKDKTSSVECNFLTEEVRSENPLYNNVDSSGKSFYCSEAGFNSNTWTLINNGNSDSSLRAYTLDDYSEEKTLESISIQTPPNKTVYYEGEYFDPTGMVIKATYSDNSYILITEVANHEQLAYGTTRVEIEYNGKTAYQNVTVKARPAEENTIPTNITPTNTVPDNTTPTNTVPTNTTPENVTPENTVPDNTVPQNETSGETSVDNLKATVTDITEDYVRVQISNLPKNNNYEVVSYSYFLTNNQTMDYDKMQFIDIENPKMSGNTMEFDIIGNTLVNNNDLDLAKDVYLFIKRTTRIGTAIASEVSNPMKFSINSSSKEVIEDLEEKLYEKAKYTLKDDTVAKDDIPQTGMEPIITIIILAGVVGLSLSIRYFILKSKVR